MPENGPVADSIDSLDLQAAGLPEFTITDTAALVETDIGSNYCMANPNSTGEAGRV